MKALTVKQNELGTATLPQLLKGFEQCVENIFKSRALMFKIVSTIDNRNLFSKKSNYSKKQLKLLTTKGITDPWNHTTRDVMINLYEHFSWSQYTKFGMLAKSIDIGVAERVSEDALILLNKKREDIDIILPHIKKFKGVITRDQVQVVLDEKTKKVRKTTKSVGKVTKITNVKRLQTALRNSLTTNQKLHDENKDLRKEIRRLKKL